MASANQHYPDYLNPFDEEEETAEQDESIKPKIDRQTNDYPDYLSPFDREGDGLESKVTVIDYDDSLNPFGSDEENEQVPITTGLTNHIENRNKELLNKSIGDGNPFEGDDESEQQDEVDINQSITANSLTKSYSPQPDSLEQPPVPLPRTKSLLKKEQAQKNKQLQHLTNEKNLTNSLLSTTPSTSSSSITTTTGTTTASTTTGSFQRKKNKRNAPPVPINFKRQVSGSLDEIEEELNYIGDKLEIIEKETNLCQENLKKTYQVEEEEFKKSHSEFVELIKRKNSVVRRQKELMYRKREMKLDQIHSDIEYELRMIGNKQMSHRTAEDETREKELLKKLVEIVEEKSDIVENLNKDTSCDSYDIEEALKRLNILPNGSLKEQVAMEMKNTSKASIKNSSSASPKNTSSSSIKNENCDKSSLAIGNKLSKIATLLPKGGTIKGTIKMKRKSLFKKRNPQPIER